METTDDSFLMLSALQHFLFCPRQFALIHIERQWRENRLTAEGVALHENAHGGAAETRVGVRVARTLDIASVSLRLRGQCDVVEFHDDGRIVPVEYKRGRPKAHRADEVQVCAQAIALEEMLEKPDGFIASAFLFYGENRRRCEVVLDAELRRLTRATAAAMHACFESGKTPAVSASRDGCKACSLLEICAPNAGVRGGVRARFSRLLDDTLI